MNPGQWKENVEFRGGGEGSKGERKRMRLSERQGWEIERDKMLFMIGYQIRKLKDSPKYEI